MTNEPLVPSSLCLTFTLSSSPPSSLLASPLVSCSFLSFDNPFSQICYCRREMSHCFQPFQPPLPSCHPCCHLFSLCPPTSSRSPLPFDSPWVATVSWDTVSSLSLTPTKLPLLIPSPFLSASTFLSPPFLSPFCFCFHLLLLSLLQLHQQFSTLFWRHHGGPLQNEL